MLKIKPEDAASEMVGQTFEVMDSFTSGSATLSSGDQVKVEKWDASSEHDVEVTVLTGKAAGQKLKVPQRILQPAHTAVAGVSPYSAGVKSQAKTVKKAEDELTAFEATKGSFKTDAAKKKFAAEEKRQQDLLTRRRDALNRKEIQEQMFNRFDAIIAREVAAANTAHGLTGKDALDPNLLKAQLFEESELGTAGEFMSVPPTNPVMTRFNLGEVIDSSGMALLTYMEREQTALVTKYNLGNLRKDLIAAQNEKNKLESKPSRSPAEESRLQVLTKKAGRSWEVFIWEYVASGQTQGFQDAVNELFSGPSAKNVDYAFWIHLAILWLFEKKKSGKSWPDTIKAYNGSGAQAEHYKAAIVKRAADAASSSGRRHGIYTYALKEEDGRASSRDGTCSRDRENSGAARRRVRGSAVPESGQSRLRTPSGFRRHSLETRGKGRGASSIGNQPGCRSGRAVHRLSAAAAYFFRWRIPDTAQMQPL